MAESLTAARPYAKALYEVVVQENSETWLSAMLVCKSLGGSEESRRFLISRDLTLDKFNLTLKALFAASNVAEVPVKFFEFTKVLSQNKRYNLLPEIAELFIEELNKSNQTVVAEITTAKPLGEINKTKLLDKLSVKYGKKVEATIKIDESLIGGAVIKVGDTVIDGSVKGRLEQLSKALN